MATKLTIALAVIVATLLVLAITSRKSVEASVVIQADAATVWSVISDPTSYPDWNPILTAVAGDFAPGEIMDVDMKNENGSVSKVKARVKSAVPNRKLNQVGGVPGVLTFNHVWTLEPTDGGTRVTQHEVYRGIGVLFWDPSWVGSTYQRANRNLKQRIESDGTPAR